MSRSGYQDNCENWALIRWRGAVTKAIEGKRGQAFLKEMLEALDALPEKKLIRGDILTPEGECCAIGSVVLKRKADVADVTELQHFVELDCHESLANKISDMFNISPSLAREIQYINDEMWWGREQSPEQTFQRVRNWVVENIREAS